jgi:Domain of unknown function (DUF4280)
MAQLVCMGASLACSFGMAPSALAVIPKGRPVLAGVMPAAAVADMAPLVNILPFAMCISPANPVVAAATAAAMGVLVPMPCIPAIVAPWAPGSPDVLINEIPALDYSCTCQCMWGGTISVTSPGQVTVILDE